MLKPVALATHFFGRAFAASAYNVSRHPPDALLWFENEKGLAVGQAFVLGFGGFRF